MNLLNKMLIFSALRILSTTIAAAKSDAWKSIFAKCYGFHNQKSFDQNDVDALCIGELSINDVLHALYLLPLL